MKSLTKSDVLAVTGLSPMQFARWTKADQPGGPVVPAEGGGSAGKARRLHLMTVVGIAVATQFYRSERGCVMGFVREVIARFAAMREEELVAHLEAGRTRLVPVGGLPLVRPEQCPHLPEGDVGGAYRKVAEYCQKFGRVRPRQQVVVKR